MLAIQYLDPKSLVPYENNAKVHTTSQVAILKENIKAYGFDQPIVVDSNNTIIKGHGRTLAAISLGLAKVPVVVADHLTPEQVKAARIADNKVSSTKYDDELLRLDLEDFDLSTTTASLLGMEEAEFDKILKASAEALGEYVAPSWEDDDDIDEDDSKSLNPYEYEDDDDDEPTRQTVIEDSSSSDKRAYKASFGVLVKCNDEHHQMVVYEDLVANGYDVKMLEN